MNWEHLKVFLAVANKGSALAASQFLEINHSTVIRRIDQLEAMIGAKLFYRHQTGYRLTNDGIDVLSVAKEMEYCALKLLGQIKGKDSRIAGKLTVSQPGNSLIDISNAVCAFSRLYPEIELNLINTVETIDLNRFEADVAIRLTDTPPEALVGRQITRLKFGVYTHHEYARRFDGVPDPAKCNWLLWTGARSTTVPAAHHPDKLFTQQYPQYKVILRSNSMEDVLAGLKAGMGVGIISTCRGDEEDTLVRLPYETIINTLGYGSVGLWLLMHPEMKQSAMIGAFLNFMSDYCATSMFASQRTCADPAPLPREALRAQS